PAARPSFPTRRSSDLRLCGHRHRDLLAAGARGVPRRVRASVGAFVTAGIRAGLVRAGVRGSRVLGSGFLSRSACYRSVLGGVLATLRSTVLGSIIGTSALGGGVFGAAILPGVAANGLLGIGGSGRRLATTDVLRFS